MKIILIILIPLILLSCSKNNLENNIQENFESVGELKKYKVYINSTNGGTVNISSQQGDVNESDLDQQIITSFKSASGEFYTGKFAGDFLIGNSIDITAINYEGFEFIGWTGYKCVKCYWSMTPMVYDERTMTQTINSNVLIIANFEEKLP